MTNDSTIEPWQTATPAEVGFVPDLGERLDAGVRSGLLRDLHGVVVARNAHIVLERYYAGRDEAWGRPLGHVTFGPETLHDVRSATKSIVSLLYAIALGRGLVAPPEAPLLAQFPDYSDLASDPQRQRLTIAHALTMTLGMEWDETLPYTDPANSELAMESAADRTRFVLDRPFVAEPGTRWIYSGGAVALIGRLIEIGSGLALPEFARAALFEPLGISTFEWAEGRDGTASAASGLRLTPRDLLKIGALVLADGTLNGRRIVAPEWLRASFRPAIETVDGLDYGWLWHLGRTPAPHFADAPRWMGAFGNGGQRLWVMPEAGLTVAILAGAYNAPDAWVTPMRIWREIVVANLVGA